MSTTKKTPPKFRLATGANRNENDERGVVRIQCCLIATGRDGNRPVKGNIVRTLRLQDVTVSEVIAAIEAALIE